MRIIIDLQGLQSEGSRIRGIGRYTFEFIRNLIKFFPDNEYILFANSLLKDLRLEFIQELKIKNVNYIEWFSPAPFDYTSNDYIKSKLATYFRSYIISCLYADVIIITSFLEGFADNCLIEIDDISNTKIVSIFYDLIPFLNPDLYLNKNPEFRKFYQKKLKDLTKLDGLLAISNSSAIEASKFLEIENNRVFNISSACDQSIFNLGKNIDSPQGYLADEMGPFLLYTGAGDPRKNLKGLLKAYSMLSVKLSKYKLVLVGKLLDSERLLIDNWINLYGINPRNIIKTGYISDEELVNFYRTCELFIFPSFHEGFGLPVLEAMCCGAPVIGSNLTSISEVISFEKAMFDPYNVNEISELIERSILDLNFRRELLFNAKQQSQKFSWHKTIESTIKALDIIKPDNITNRNLLSFDTWQEQNSNHLDLLFRKIVKLTDFRFHISDELLIQVSSCIDKMNLQLSDFVRVYSSNQNLYNWKLEGPFDSNYSLAILNKLFFKSLSKFVQNVSIKISEGFGDYQPNINYLKRYPIIFQKYIESKSNSQDWAVQSRNMFPPRVKDLNSRINLLHLYGWEESEFPSTWVDEFNTYLQGLTVMSSQVKKILMDNGVYIPIKISNLGLDHIDEIEVDLNFHIPGKKFKFLHISSCFPRKGIDILLKSFFNTFTGDDQVSLIIKTFDNPHNNIEEQIKELSLLHHSTPNVIIIKDELNEIQLKSLILSSDVLVAPSRGEGFGLPIGEAMRLGIPVITTAWGGQRDFCNSQNCWLLDYQFVKANSHFDLDLSYWAEPSSTHLCELLRMFYDCKLDDIHKKISRAKEQTENLKWDIAAIQNKTFVDKELTFYKNKFIKVGVVSTWFSRCGIACYTKHLVDNLVENIHIFSPLYEEKQNHNRYNIIPSWYASDTSKDLNFLYEKILSCNITSLIIQFNYGFFEFNQLSELIIKLKSNNISVIIIIHSCRDAEPNQKNQFHLLYDAFKLCDRLIVHSIDDLNRLKEVSLIDNVCLIPHGILDFKYKKRFYFLQNIFSSINKKVIATYGFCLPNKGFKELIQAIHILKLNNINIRLNIFSAIYSQDYHWFYQELVELIEELSLEKLVTINTKYMDDIETFDHLSNHDCVIFPYQTSSESSSASVRNALSTLRPVLVTPIDIFSDVSELVEYLPGVSPEDIASGLIKFFANKSYVVNYKSDEFVRKKSIVQQRSFAKVANRILSLIKSIEYNKY